MFKLISASNQEVIMNKRLKNCPVCNSNLDIVEYYCPQCNTSIKGKFGGDDFAVLNPNQQEFVKIFICCQGNIKEVEKALKISYPTVKNKLSEVTTILCPERKQIPKFNSDDILKEIEEGNISVDDAISKLKERS